MTEGVGRRGVLRRAAAATAVGGLASQPRETPQTVTVGVGPDGEYVFRPGTDAPLYIRPGTTVRWIWMTDGHNIVVGSQPEEANWRGTLGGKEGRFPDGYIYEYTFTVNGRYHYWCQPHKSLGMVADIVVNEEGRPTPTRAPTEPSTPASKDSPAALDLPVAGIVVAGVVAALGGLAVVGGVLLIVGVAAWRLAGGEGEDDQADGAERASDELAAGDATNGGPDDATDGDPNRETDVADEGRIDDGAESDRPDEDAADGGGDGGDSADDNRGDADDADGDDGSGTIDYTTLLDEDDA